MQFERHIQSTSAFKILNLVVLLRLLNLKSRPTRTIHLEQLRQTKLMILETLPHFQK